MQVLTAVKAQIDVMYVDTHLKQIKNRISNEELIVIAVNNT